MPDLNIAIPLRLPNTGVFATAFASLVLFSLQAFGQTASTEPNADGAAAPIRIERIQAGFAGYGRVGEPLPVAVELFGTTNPESLEVMVSATDPSGNICQFPLQPSATHPASAVRAVKGLQLYSGTILIGRQSGIVSISVTNDGEQIAGRDLIVVGASKDDPVPASDETTDSLSMLRHDQDLVVVFGEPIGVAELARDLSEASGGNRPLVMAGVSDPASYDDCSASAFLAADSIVVADNSELTEKGVRNLRRWTLSGGHLVVGSCGGAESLRDSPLGRWIANPLGLSGETRRVKESDLTSIQVLVRGATRLTSNRRDFYGSAIDETEADVLADSPDGPLITRLVAGSGLVTLIALDLQSGPLAQWNSSAGLYGYLLGNSVQESDTDSSPTGQRISQSGISDLSSQFADELEVVTASERWSTWSVMGLLVGLLVLIGPIDYFLVTRILKRPRLTWLTLPLFVGGSVVAINTVDQRPEVGDIITSQVDLIDMSTGPLGSGIHSQTWVSLSSRKARRAAISWNAEPQLAALVGKPFDNEAQLNWFGRAEDIFGGMYRQGGLSLGQLSYEIDHRTVQGLPLLSGSSETLHGDAWVPTDQPLVTSQLRTVGRRFLAGKLTHHLPWTLKNYIIVQDQRVYLAADEAPPESRHLSPNVTLDLAENVKSVDLKTFLTQSRIAEIANTGSISSHHVAVARPYEKIDHSEFTVLVMATLHDAAGGSQYTSLENRQFRDLELTQNLRLKQAILIAQVETPATEFTAEDASITRERLTTMVRIMIPVLNQPAPDSRDD